MCVPDANRIACVALFELGRLEGYGLLHDLPSSIDHW